MKTPVPERSRGALAVVEALPIMVFNEYRCGAEGPQPLADTTYIISPILRKALIRAVVERSRDHTFMT